MQHKKNSPPIFFFIFLTLHFTSSQMFSPFLESNTFLTNDKVEERIQQLKEELKGVEFAQHSLSSLLENAYARLNFSTDSFHRLLNDSKQLCLQNYNTKLQGFADFAIIVNNTEERQTNIHDLMTNISSLINSTVISLRALATEVTERGEGANHELMRHTTSRVSFRPIDFVKDRRSCILGSQNPLRWENEKKLFIYSQYNISWVRYITKTDRLCMFNVLSSVSFCSEDEVKLPIFADVKYACRN